MTENGYIRGSAQFIRLLAALVLGSTLAVSTGALVWGGAPLGGYAVIAGGILLLLVRTLFLGVWIRKDSVRIVSWYWTHRVPLECIARVTMERYTGALGVDVGVLPFVGSVRIIAFWLHDGRLRVYPSTLAPTKNIRYLCRAIREHVH